MLKSTAARSTPKAFGIIMGPKKMSRCRDRLGRSKMNRVKKIYAIAKPDQRRSAYVSAQE